MIAVSSPVIPNLCWDRPLWSPERSLPRKNVQMHKSTCTQTFPTFDDPRNHLWSWLRPSDRPMMKRFSIIFKGKYSRPTIYLWMPVVWWVNSILTQACNYQGLVYDLIMSLYKQNLKESSTGHILKNHYKTWQLHEHGKIQQILPILVHFIQNLSRNRLILYLFLKCENFR